MRTYFKQLHWQIFISMILGLLVGYIYSIGYFPSLDINIPFTDITVPIPQEEIMVTAATTAFISVAATLTATSLFKQCVKVFKPIFMQLFKRIQKKLNGNPEGKAEESSA